MSVWTNVCVYCGAFPEMILFVVHASTHKGQMMALNTTNRAKIATKVPILRPASYFIEMAQNQ